MSKKKRTDKNKLIRSRALQTIIGTSQSLNKDEVQDVINALAEVVYLATSRGYEVSIPKVGFFTYMDKEGRKKGDRIKMPSYMIDGMLGKEYEGKKLVQEGEDYYFEYIEDQPNYRLPHFTFYKAFTQKVKEESVNWLD